jgi:hypothetical protein
VGRRPDRVQQRPADVLRGLTMGYNDMVRREAQRAACKGAYGPYTFKVTVNDSHDEWRYKIASAALWGQSTSIGEFFRLSAEYVLRHHRQLAEVRRKIREEERALRRIKKRREREDRAARRDAEERWRRSHRG